MSNGAERSKNIKQVISWLSMDFRMSVFTFKRVGFDAVMFSVGRMWVFHDINLVDMFDDLLC